MSHIRKTGSPQGLVSNASEHTDSVLLADRGEVTVLTLNRPAKLNAFDRQLWEELAEELECAAGDVAVKVVVITGAGRAFTAGQDMAEMVSMAEEGESNPAARIMSLLVEYPVPLVAAVNGIAAGFGLGLVMHCDLVFMAESARLGAPFVKIGLAMDAGMSHLLPQRIGYSRAARLLFSGGWLSADDAAESGLAVAVSPDGAVLEAALMEAARIAKNPGQALRATKRLLLQAHSQAAGDALAREQEVFAGLAASQEHRRAVAAFLADS